MSPSPSRSTRALVTGASRGIGRELARLIAEDDEALVLVARSEDALEEVAGELRALVDVRVLTADLSRGDERERIVKVLDEEGIRISTLVNNAGFGTFGPFADAERTEELDQIRLNVEAVTDLTHRFLAPMLHAGRGRILNVASTAAFQPGPLMAVYYATKAYVLSFSQALAEELSGSGITVTCLCPGPTRTDFHARADMEDSRLLRFGRMTADAVARRGYQGLVRGERVVIPGVANRMASILVRLLPSRLVTKTVRILQERVE